MGTGLKTIYSIVLFVILIFLSGSVNAATRTTSAAGNWNTAASWGGQSVPSSTDIANINHGLNLNTNLTINSGGTYTFNASNTAGTPTLTMGDHFLTSGGTLNINAPAVVTMSSGDLYFGTIHVYSGATLNFTGSVDMERTTIIIDAGGTLNVGGNFYNTNGLITNNGLVTVGGNYTSNSTLLSGSLMNGTGLFTSEGSMITTTSLISFPSTIFGSSDDCTTGPCSGNCLPGLTVGAITGSSTVCQGAAGVVYSVPAVTGATTYNWTLPAGSTITDGAGTRSVTVTLGTSSGNVKVIALNPTTTCRGSSTKVITVTNAKPSGTAVITGTATACQNTAGFVYSVSGVTGATAYAWTVPAGATITSGAGTSSITVTMGSVNGAVGVTPSNACGNATGITVGTKAVTLAVKPAAVIAYTSDTYCRTTTTLQTPVITGTTGGVFSYTGPFLAVMSGFNSSTGSFTPNGSGATLSDRTYTVTYTIAAASGCAAATASQTITITTNTTISGTPTGTTSVCQNTAGVGYSVPAVTNASTYDWALPPGAVITAGATTRTITVTMGSVSGNVALTPIRSDGCYGTTTLLAVTVNPCALTWTGATNTDWSTAANWSTNVLPTNQNDIIIPNVTRKPVVSSGQTATVAKITVDANASVTINGNGTLNAFGNVVNNGLFTANSGSSVVLKGTSAQSISGVPVLYNTTVTNTSLSGVTVSSALIIKGKLALLTGVLNTNGNVQIDPDNGGNIGYNTTDAGSVSGNITIFRAINAATTHYISCPLNGVTAEDVADDAEVINPSNGNTRLFHYDNTSKAWIPDLNMSNLLVPGNAYSMWFPVPTSVDYTGTYNHAAPAYSYSGTNTANKFLFVSNPYPGTLDWDAASGWVKANVKNAIYFWDPANNRYAAYVSGIGTNGGTQYIPAMNSFFVAYAGTGGTTATITMDGRVRSAQSAALWRTASDETVRLTLKNSTASDETVIRFSENATNSFDDDFDAYKMMNSGSVPSIYTTFGTDRYSVNSIASMYAKDTIPILIKVPADGDYVLSINISDPTVSYLLADKKLGTQSVITTSDYAFTALKTDDLNRFELQMRTNVTTDAKKISALAELNILSSPDGFLIRSGLSGNSIIEVMDMAGKRIKLLSDVSLKNGDNFFMPGLSEGMYLVKVTMENISYVGQVSIRK